MRVTLASHLIQRGVSVFAVQDLLGHSSITSTQVYLGVDMGDLRRAVKLLEV